jgi:hypothetical protein
MPRYAIAEPTWTIVPRSRGACAAAPLVCPDKAEIRDLGRSLVLLRLNVLEEREYRRHRVVDPDVDLAERLLHLPGRGVHRRGVRDVGAHHHGPAAGRFDLMPRRFERLLAAPDEPQRHIGPGEAPDDRPADALASTGHNDDFAHPCRLPQ